MARLEFTVQKQYPASGSAPGFALDVQLACEADITVLFGPSGSGKTMTLDALAGFLRPDRGRILLHNEILFDAESGVCLPPRRRGIGYVFQSYALFPHMTVEENLAFGIRRLRPLDRRRRVREMLEQLGLAPLATRRPHELSGGEKQRTSIARALLPEPRLLLLDEPARGLDYPLRQELYEILRNLRQKYRIPVLLVTHDVRESFVLADQVAVYLAGRIVQTGKPAQVFSQPCNPSVARLLGIANIFCGTVEELDPTGNLARIRTPLFPVTVDYLPGRLRGDTVWFCIPQEQVSLLPSGTPKKDSHQENYIPVELIEAVEMPHSVRLLLRIRGENNNSPPLRIESELPRSAYKRLAGLSQKQWSAAFPKAFIHVFNEPAG